MGLELLLCCGSGEIMTQVFTGRKPKIESLPQLTFVPQGSCACRKGALLLFPSASPYLGVFTHAHTCAPPTRECPHAQHTRAPTSVLKVTFHPHLELLGLSFFFLFASDQTTTKTETQKREEKGGAEGALAGEW